MIRKEKLILILIILFAAVLRFWQLGNVPVSPDWDEASLGYNAYSILNTGKDEYGKFLPVALQSFGDYKPALYSYTAIPSIAVFGLDNFAVRFPSAVLGLIAILVAYFLVNELFKKEKLALFSAFLLAISPWHIQFSRVAFEANLGLTLNILVALFFLKGLKRPWMLILSAFFSALSIYAYQSEKIFAPLFLFILLIIYRKDFLAVNKKYIISFFAVGIFLVLPMLSFLLFNKDALNRAKSTVISSNADVVLTDSKRLENDRKNKDYIGIVLDNRRVTYGKQVISSYLSHFDPNFLFIAGDADRHHAPFMGLLYLFELPFLLLGIYLMIFKNNFGRKEKIFIFSWFLIAPIPAAIANDAPHAVRTLNFLPTFQIFTAFGLLSVIYCLVRVKSKTVKLAALSFIAVAAFFNFAYYLDQYFVQLNYFNSKDWQYGYKEAVSYIDSVRNRYDSVLVSDKTPLDQSYIFFLYYLKYSPKKYQETVHNASFHDFDNYKFGSLNSMPESQNNLYVGSPSEASPRNTLKTIFYLNGEEAIRIKEGSL